MFFELTEKYSGRLARLDSLPEANKFKARRRFLILKEFVDCVEKNEQHKLQKKYRRKAALRKFCKEKGVSVSTFYRWERAEKKNGIEGLIPHYGIWGWENDNAVFLTTSIPNKNQQKKTLLSKFH